MAEHPVLRERALTLQTRPDPSNKPTRLRIEPDKYNRITFSCQAAMNLWINVAVTIDEWAEFIQDLIDLANDVHSNGVEVECFKNQMVDSRLVIGKDDDGCIYIELSSTKTPHSKRFEFVPLRQYVRTRGGAAIDPRSRSRSRCLAWCRLIDPIMTRLWETNYRAADNGGQGGGNRNYNNGGGNRNYNNGGQQRQQGGNWGGQQKQWGAPQNAPVADGNVGDYIDLP